MNYLKFKYWHKGKMLDVSSLHFTSDQVVVNGNLIGGILLQNTGLKHVVHKDIYEQDVAILTFKTEWGSLIKKHGVMVKSSDGQWVFETQSPVDVFALSDKPKVVGNIYENPELLPLLKE